MIVDLNITHLFNELVLKRHDRKIFPKHFLASVHSEIRSIEINVDQVIEKKKALESAFADLGFKECQDSNNIEMKLINNTLTQTFSKLGLKFINPDPKREFQIINGAIILSDFAYDNLENFMKRFYELFKTLESVLDISENSTVEKIGLRKIDSIIIKPVTNIPDSLSIFNPSLFSIARSGLILIDTFSTLEEALVLQKEEHLSIVKTRLSKKADDALEANLDFDLIYRSESNFNEAFTTILKKLNQIHFDLFMWSVTDKMIKVMEAP